MNNPNQAPAQQGNGQTTAVTERRVNPKVELLKSVLHAPSIQEQFANVLKDHKDAFVTSIIDLYNSDSQLQACNPNQVVAEALKAATMNLPINRALGFAYIVVFNNSVKQPDGTWVKVPTPTFVPGYKGYIQLAMRTGQYRTINADLVYEGEVRKVNKLTGEIAFDGERTSDKVAGYFCYFELLNGFAKTLYMTVHDMASYAKRYSPVREERDYHRPAGETGQHIGSEQESRLGGQLQRHGIEDRNQAAALKVRLPVNRDAGCYGC